MKVDWYVYEPLEWQERIGYSVDLERCRHQVPEGGRSVGFRQCSRIAREVVRGYGFCRQHANFIREKFPEGADDG